jgi:tnpV protein
MIMEKVIYDEKNGLGYELQGDYYIPCLKLPDEEQQPIGIWGQRHLRYIKQNRKVLYLNLLTSGKLNGYLADLNKQAEEMFSLLVKQMAERDGVTEQLKAENQLKWVARMNNIRSRATESVNDAIIFS